MGIQEKGLFDNTGLSDMWEDLNLSKVLPIALVGVDLAFNGGEMVDAALNLGGEVAGGVGESLTNLTS